MLWLMPWHSCGMICLSGTKPLCHKQLAQQGMCYGILECKVRKMWYDHTHSHRWLNGDTHHVLLQEQNAYICSFFFSSSLIFIFNNNSSIYRGRMNQKNEKLYDPTAPLLGIYSKELKTHKQIYLHTHLCKYAFPRKTLFFFKDVT